MDKVSDLIWRPFAAYGNKFLNNYIKNISIYIRQLKIAQIDNNHDEKQRNKFKAWLKKITVKHVTIAVGLLDYYHELAKAQHGASKVNLLPWEFYDRVSQLAARLELMSKSINDKVWKNLTSHMDNLKLGIINNVHIGTELPTVLRSNELDNDPSVHVKGAIETLQNITKLMSEQLRKDIGEPSLITDMRQAFSQWSESHFIKLIEKSKQANRDYGTADLLIKEYKILKDNVKDYPWTNTITEAGKWLKICTTPSFFRGCETMIHFSLCCFVKSPLEAVVESVGSIINRHGYGQRSRLTAEHLSEEIMVAFNGPPKFSSASYSLIRESLYQYFKGKPIHFYKNTKKSNFEVQSSTIAAIRRKSARIIFNNI